MIDDWFVEHDGQRLVLDPEKVQSAFEAKQAIEDELRAELAIAECLATEMSARATRAEQERDEAYERAVQAIRGASSLDENGYIVTKDAMIKTIRRLAAKD